MQIFEQSWRWYGPDDPTHLTTIKQAGAHGVVTALHHIPVGQLWTVEEIQKRLDLIAKSNEENPFHLYWNVVESLPVHEHIKQGLPDRDELIENYKQSLINLSKCGIRTICYNFMPILDWLRTNVKHKIDDGSTALFHDYIDVIIFDCFILKRPNAASDYRPELLAKAESKYQKMSPSTLENIKRNLLLALPGEKDHFTLSKLQKGIDAYKKLSADQLRENLIYFLQKIIPTAEAHEINMAIHPDDPPWPVLGLPRIVSQASDLEYLFDQVKSENNGLTFCSGSLGASPDNDMKAIIKKWHSRIHFVHLRSVQRTDERTFHEANHLEGNAEMYDLMRTFYDCQQASGSRPLPMRPDHGHEMINDHLNHHYPGYSSVGRIRGLAELRGLEIGITKTLSN